MKIEFRRYVQSDIEKLIDAVEREHLANIDPERRKGFSREKVTNLLMGNLRNSLFFLTVAVKDGEIVGGLCASIYSFIFSYEAEANDHLFFIQKEHRSMEVATGLVDSYIAWAKERKVKRVELRNVTGQNVEAFSKIEQKRGFQLVGTFHAMEL